MAKWFRDNECDLKPPGAASEMAVKLSGSIKLPFSPHGKETQTLWGRFKAICSDERLSQAQVTLLASPHNPPRYIWSQTETCDPIPPLSLLWISPCPETFTGSTTEAQHSVEQAKVNHIVNLYCLYSDNRENGWTEASMRVKFIQKADSNRLGPLNTREG